MLKHAPEGRQRPQSRLKAAPIFTALQSVLMLANRRELRPGAAWGMTDNWIGPRILASVAGFVPAILNPEQARVWAFSINEESLHFGH